MSCRFLSGFFLCRNILRHESRNVSSDGFFLQFNTTCYIASALDFSVSLTWVSTFANVAADTNNTDQENEGGYRSNNVIPLKRTTRPRSSCQNKQYRLAVGTELISNSYQTVATICNTISRNSAEYNVAFWVAYTSCRPHFVMKRLLLGPLGRLDSELRPSDSLSQWRA